jgi:ubiquinone/menaquinone biosynthesis C-methylase UbiE
MSSFVYMKVLESAPHRYDLGMRLLSWGRIAGLYRTLAERVAAPGRRILDLGCGTGGVALACAARGADVTGIDGNAGMLEVARARAAAAGLQARVRWLQIDAAEVEDHIPPASLDAVTACLVLSELTPREQAYALAALRSRLRPGGVLLIADEVAPEGRLARLAWRLRRLPLLAVTFLLTQTATRPLHDAAARVREAGFAPCREQRLWGGSLLVLETIRPRESP